MKKNDEVELYKLSWNCKTQDESKPKDTAYSVIRQIDR